MLNPMARALADGRPMTCFDCGNVSALDEHVADARAAVSRTERVNDMLRRVHERFLARIAEKDPR